ncbi:MAG: UDP-glucose 4-epimerase GalE, partial [Selenomonadaceae bacterium]|nr:UDP-glucose 4-epimerase GalE [Selenomonadaceae bacterium]
VIGRKIKKELGARRPGDPARLIASGAKARKVLQWTPRFDDVEKIIATAWQWHTLHPNGYED